MILKNKKYECLLVDNNKLWNKYREKHSVFLHKNITNMFKSEAYQFISPNYEKKADITLNKMFAILEKNDLIIKECDFALDNYRSYLIHVESLHKFNSDIDELYYISFNFLWKQMKSLTISELREVKCILEN